MPRCDRQNLAEDQPKPAGEVPIKSSRLARLLFLHVHGRPGSSPNRTTRPIINFGRRRRTSARRERRSGATPTNIDTHTHMLALI